MMSGRVTREINATHRDGAARASAATAGGDSTRPIVATAKTEVAWPGKRIDVGANEGERPALASAHPVEAARRGA